MTSRERAEEALINVVLSESTYEALVALLVKTIDAAVAYDRKESGLHDVSGRSRAWDAVFALCLELGMDVFGEDTGLDTVIAFIRARGAK